ncbi:hypothetical protein ABGT24_00565 [Peribacillus frigoritolerans]|uniref:hypothetical protein n=1 Tax=Peribacillus frigoritolerans TaxID=450367 RepID=UPI00345D314A
MIQNLMGHEKSETTKIYAYLSGVMRRDLYRKRPRFLFILFLINYRGRIVHQSYCIQTMQ